MEAWLVMVSAPQGVPPSVSPSTSEAAVQPAIKRRRRPQATSFIMALIILVLGSYLILPLILLLILSFNTAPDIFVGPTRWGFSAWTTAFRTDGLLASL